MRTEFEMKQEDLDAILEASKPVTVMLIGGIPPRSPQENANDAWAALGRKMGFNHMTVKPVHGKSNRFFTAESNGERGSRNAIQDQKAQA